MTIVRTIFPQILTLLWLTCSQGIDESKNHQTGDDAFNFGFVDIADEVGITLQNISGSPENKYILESLGAGAAWLDYDQDGFLDLYIVNGSRFDLARDEAPPRNRLYRNDGNGSFRDVTAQTDVGDDRWGIGCAAGDINNDGYPDLFVTNYGTNVLYLNNADGTFSDITEAAGVGDVRMGASCAFGDYDNDGYLDLYVTNYVQFDPENPPNNGEPCHWYGIPVYCGPEGLIPEADLLYHNNGDGTFTDVSHRSGIDYDKGYGLGVVFGDFDQDGDADIYVANDSSPNFLFRNNGDGTFTDVGIPYGVAYREDGQEQAGMGVDFGDYDKDSDQDLFVTNFSDDYNTLYQNQGDGFFQDMTALAGMQAISYYKLGWGANFYDFNNDGNLDIFVANGHVYPQADRESSNTSYRQRNQLFLNTSSKRFAEISDHLGSGMALVKSSRGTALADFDNDGDIDVFVVNEKDVPNLLRNDGGNENHWLRITLQGVESNRGGIGAHIRITANGNAQYREVRRNCGYASSQDPAVHFGLGQTTEVDSLEVRWPSGLLQTFRNISANQHLTIVQGSDDFQVAYSGH